MIPSSVRSVFKTADFISPLSPIPTYHFQKSLPRLPIPKLEETCAKYVNVVTPVLTAEELTQTKASVDEFLQRAGPALHDQLVKRDKLNKETSYISKPWYHMYLAARTPIIVNYNPFLMFRDHPDPSRNTQVHRATAFIVSSLKFQRSLKYQVLEPEVFHLGDGFTEGYKKLISYVPSSLSWYVAYLKNSYALDMSQYNKLFGTARIPHLGEDQLVTSSDSKHIVVSRKGHFFVVNVLNSDGTTKPIAEIEASIRGITEENLPETFGIGSLTAEDRNVWAKLRAELIADPTNKASLHLIDTALFVVNLDDEAPTSLEAANRQFLHGDGRNRWFDKSFSILVAKNGKAAVNFEHSWGDGVAVLRYVNEIYKDSLQAPLTNSTGKINPTKLQWNLPESVKKGISTATQNVDALIKSLEFKTKIIEGYGKSYFKSKSVSPDGSVQMGFQLAYNRMYGKTVATYESASTAGFLHGRTETIRPASAASVEMVKTFADQGTTVAEKQDKFKKAVSVHSAFVRDAAMGKGVDRHLFALLNLAKENGDKIPAIFRDKAYSIINHNILSTSTLSSEAIEGGGFGPVVADGYGIGYSVQDNLMGFNVTSYHKDTSRFLTHLEQSLHDIRKVLDGHNL